MRIHFLIFLLTTISFVSGSLFFADGGEFAKREQDEKAWRIGGKIHFEERSGFDYVGTLELNKEARKALKEFFDVGSDSCADNAKVLLKKSMSCLYHRKTP